MTAAEQPRRSKERVALEERGGVLLLAGHLSKDDVPLLCERVRSLIERRPGGSLTCDVGGLEQPDLGAMEVLARLQLAARRCGSEIGLRRPPSELRRLLELVGLASVLKVCD